MSIAPFSGFYFWMLLALFIAGYSLLRFLAAASWIRNIFNIVMSLIIIGLIQDHSEGLYLLCFLILILLLVFGGGRALLSGSSSIQRKRINISLISFTVLVLCFFKYSDFQMGFMVVFQYLYSGVIKTSLHWNKGLFLLGVSYFSFKFIHFLADCYNKKIKNLNLLTFMNYILFFPSFFSGPINRYNSFAENLSDSITKRPDYAGGAKRIIHGLFRKIVLANSLLPYTIISLDLNSPSVTPLQAIVGIYAYMVYVFFDFSGYTEMAIGTGKLVGINLPENFNYPFFRRNLREFWANWHMSLTTWLTDYIYWPLARRFRHVEELRKRPITNSNICMILTFMVCGLWHGDGKNFFIWGTYHGVGLAILNSYGYLEKKYYPRRWREVLNKSRFAYGVSSFITLQFVAFGFLLFGLDIERIRLFFRIFM